MNTYLGVINYLMNEGFVDSYESAISILEVMSDQWLEEIIEANRFEKHQEKKFKDYEKESKTNYRASKDIAMMKSRRREGAFRDLDTHKNYERREPGTHGHSDVLRTQRKQAHNLERKVPKKKPGTSPEERTNGAIWKRLGISDKSPMEKLSKSEIRSRRQSVLGKGERRRGLRTQAIKSLGRTLGYGHVDTPTQ
jgi:hypothetical protein